MIVQLALLILALHALSMATTPASAAAAAAAVSGPGSSGSLDSLSRALVSALPHDGQLAIFISCRKECTASCDRLLYMYSNKKKYCHECIRQCIVSVLQQAESIGLNLKTRPLQLQSQQQQQQQLPMMGDSPVKLSSFRSQRRKHRRDSSGKKGNVDSDGERRRGRRERRREMQAKLVDSLKKCLLKQK